ncbi:hypothetical protein AB0L70_20280 [Kribbella sp. NPDC051952]|uniref:hypothetical protein n=1 Tax=Kribbella sp. NPDC051952 TaxID=3154851 RepID=UPI00342E58E5
MLRDVPPEIAEDTFWTKIPPPLLSMIVLGLAFVIAMLIGIGASDGTPDSKAFVVGVPWMVWRALAGAALVVFALLTVQAIRILQHPAKWGFYPPPGRAPRYMVCAIIGTLVGGLFWLWTPELGPELPIRDLQARTGVVLVGALLATVPWLTIVWLGHAECRDLKNDVGKRPQTGPAHDYADAMREDTVDPEQFRLAVRQLERLWRLLLTCAGAFTIGIIAAIASAGALRGAFVAAYPDRRDEFPPSNVLLYGGLFTLGLSVIAVPMAVAWRARAQRLVEHACPLPPDGRPTVAWTEERHRVERLLHLDIPFVRNPLTLISVTAPLLVSAFAAFLPLVAN